jgi:hypothetical protein
MQLQKEREAAAAAAAAARPRRKALEEMTFGERMRYEVMNSFKQVWLRVRRCCLNVSGA